MPVSLFFNAQSWKRLGCDDQQIRFLQGLLDRAGGTSSTTNLSSVNSSIATLNAAVATLQSVDTDSGTGTGSETTTTDTSLIEAIEDSINVLLTEINRLHHRIQELEDA